MPSRWTPGYSSPITLQLVGPQSWTEVPALLCYDGADPFAVRIAFGDVGDENGVVDLEDGGIAWLLSRELLQSGLDGPAGRRRRAVVAARMRPPMSSSCTCGPRPARRSSSSPARRCRRSSGRPRPSSRAAPRVPCSTSTTNSPSCSPTAGRTRRAADLRERSGARPIAEGSGPPCLEGSVPSVKVLHATRTWLSGRASPCQGEGRGFESRRPLGTSGADREIGAHVRWSGREARQRPAKPSTRVQIPSPPRLLRGARARRRVRPSGRRGAIGAAVARFPDTEEVTGSIPVSPTTRAPGH